MPFRTVYDLIIILVYQLVPSLLSSKLVLCKLNFILKYLHLVTFLLVIGRYSSGGILHNVAVCCEFETTVFFFTKSVYFSSYGNLVDR